MSPIPWRGTVIFTGTLAGVAVVAATRFVGADTALQNAVDPANTSSNASGTGVDTNTSASTSTGADTSASVGTDPGTPAVSSALTITGNIVQTRYGPVQVAATFNGTTLTSVTPLRHPSGHQSDQINAYAMPILNKEAVAANSAHIDTVSGATFTSQAYEQSLQSAIDQLG